MVIEGTTLYNCKASNFFIEQRKVNRAGWNAYLEYTF